MLGEAGLFRVIRKLHPPQPDSSLDSVRVVNDRPTTFPFFLADMSTDEGGVRGRAGRVSAETAVALAQGLKGTPQYRALAEILPTEWLDLYFEKRVEARIFPVIRSLCALEWLVQNGPPPPQRQVVWNNHRNLGPALLGVWPGSLVSLKLGPSFNFSARIRPRGRRVRNFLNLIKSKFGGTESSGASTTACRSELPTVAVYHAEGVDTTRRSDLFWFPNSEIDPKRVLVYLDADSLARLQTQPQTQLLEQLDSLGMRWVQLKGLGGSVPGWSPAGQKRNLMRQWRKNLYLHTPTTATQRWVAAEAATLLGEVQYWLSFYEEFNVKIHVDINEGSHVTVARSIAAEMHGGIHVGRQRSDSWGLDTLGHHPDHVYFVWNQRGALCAEGNRNRIDSTVISGFPHDNTWSDESSTAELRRNMEDNGAKFVIAFFDNAFWWGGGFSRTILRSFYTAFLRWVIEDPTLGVITKSKKPVVLEDLPELEELMGQAVSTGRWINLTDVFGRLPSDASRAADISVGIGISSAVTEAVAAGGRGVHCDLRTMRSHPFYQWGYEKVVFDDLDRMMDAFKCYKADPAAIVGFGDFSNHMDQIDPFADGRSGERAGTYLRWLLEAFDQGKDQENALRHANQQFTTAWGDDKVMTTNSQVLKV